MFNLQEEEIQVVEKLSLNLLSEVTEKLDQGNYFEADQQIEGVFTQEKIWDIRYLLYYLFSQLAQNKFDTYIAFANHVNMLLTDHYELISPIHRKEKVIQKSLDWFDKYFPDKLKQNIELFADDIELEQACQSTQSLFEAFENLGFSIASLQHKFKTVTQKTQRHEEQSQASSVTNESDYSNGSQSLGESLEAEQLSTPLDQTEHKLSAPKQQAQQAIPSHSVEWERLLNLLNDYEYYLKKGNKEVAYLAHIKIEKALREFDPITYFPRVFESYLRSKLYQYVDIFKFKQQGLENMPYSQLINSLLEHNDFNLRRMVCEKPFEYIQSELDPLESNSMQDSTS